MSFSSVTRFYRAFCFHLLMSVSILWTYWKNNFFSKNSLANLLNSSSAHNQLFCSTYILFYYIMRSILACKLWIEFLVFGFYQVTCWKENWWDWGLYVEIFLLLKKKNLYLNISNFLQCCEFIHNGISLKMVEKKKDNINKPFL